MPLCANCHERFPCRKVIDGKRRFLVRRKYCLTCSPFGAHNTRRFHLSKDGIGPNRECVRCARKFENGVAGNRGNFCSSCRVMRCKEKLKTMAIAYKGGACERCGYKKCNKALHFHHRDPAAKEFSISQMTKSWEKVRKEVDKCDLLCANCHTEVEEELLVGGRMVRHLTVNQNHVGSNPTLPANFGVIPIGRPVPQADL